MSISKHGQSDAARKGRVLRERVKRADPEWLPKYAQRVREYVDAGAIADVFVQGALLIPVPSSSPLVDGALWVPERICCALRATGLGGAIETPLKRVTAVPKSAYAAPGERPSLDVHYQSMACASSLIQPARIVLVDDVITKGRTLLAAARRVREAFPNSEVKRLR